MLPKFTLEGFVLKKPAVAAVPDSEMLSVGFGAVLVNATLPLAVPAACGVNVTLNA